MSGFFGRVCVGFLVSIPITCILAGGVEDGLALLFLSIVCTAGIGLVVWIPAWWLVGWVTFKVLGGLINNDAGNSVSQSTSVPRRRELPLTEYMALTAYIKKALASGMGVEELTHRLQLNGWNPTEIQNALASFVSSEFESNAQDQ